MDSINNLCVVTGANGFVGSHLVELLLKKGYRVRAIVRKGSNLKWLDGLDIEINTCGLNSVADLKEALKGASYIYHIAGVVKSISESGYFEGNAYTTERILEAARSVTNLKRVLVTSSMAATGPAQLGTEVDENSPLQPMEPYGYSKVLQEEIAKKYSAFFPVVVVRPPGVYGPRDTEILAYFKMIHKGWAVRMGWQNSELSLVHVQDLTEGMFLAATATHKSFDIFFLGSLERYNWKQIGLIAAKAMDKKARALAIPKAVLYIAGFFAGLAEKWFGANVDINMDRARRITQASWYCSSEKAKNELGYEQKVSLEKGMKETFLWYKEHGWL
jgi:dihydroflavonol-4-reductase